MNSPRVSVIIPTYNASRFLDETIESVLSQTFANYEIIVVDDGSTDNTPEVLRRWEPRLRVERTANRGVSAARNLGTTLARGEFLQYLDADDCLKPQALEHRLEALRHDAADVAYSDYQRLEETADGLFVVGPIQQRRIEDSSRDPAVAFLTDFWVPPVALLYRRSIVERIGRWNESLPVIQDARFALDAALAGAKFTYVPSVDALYRVHYRSHSLSNRNSDAFAKDVLRNACQIDDRWRNESAFTPDRCAALARVYDHAARRLLTVDFELFEESLKRLYSQRPGFEPTWPKVGGVLSHTIGPKVAGWIMTRWTGRKMAA